MFRSELFSTLFIRQFKQSPEWLCLHTFVLQAHHHLFSSVKHKGCFQRWMTKLPKWWWTFPSKLIKQFPHIISQQITEHFERYLYYAGFCLFQFTMTWAFQIENESKNCFILRAPCWEQEEKESFSIFGFCCRFLEKWQFFLYLLLSRSVL